MRERLIELLKEAKREGSEPYQADYLLENGVIVPPCKVGDTLYDVGEFFEDMYHPEIYKIHVGYIEFSKDDKTKEPHFCIEGFDFKQEDFGKTLFFTIEDAKRAAKQASKVRKGNV